MKEGRSWGGGGGGGGNVIVVLKIYIIYTAGFLNVQGFLQGKILITPK